MAVLSPSTLTAQLSDANLVGTVTDASGASVPDSRVELIHVATSVRYFATTDHHGHYRFGNVPVGAYTLEISAGGFARVTVRNVVLELNRTQTVNTTLQLASVSAGVDVVDAAPAIDTTTAAVQTTYSGQQAARLPLTADGTLGVLNLSLLSAGVATSGGIGYGTGPSVGGQRPTNNNFMVEGIDANNRAVTGPVLNVSNEAVAEFSLQQNQFSPEFGHSSGGQFNTLLKSGTNEVHGSVYEYFQNRNLNAVDQAYGRLGMRTSPRYDQNRFGGTIGGPIIQERLFYFGALEYQPQGFASVSSSAVYAPTAEGMRMLDGMGGLSRSNLDTFKRYVPTAASQSEWVTVRGQAIPIGLINTVGPAYTNHTRPVISMDYNASERDQLRARWTSYRSDSIENTPNLAAFFTPVETRNHLASLAWFHTFSPSLTNELRLGYTRSSENRPAGDHEFPGLDAFPNLAFNDLSLSVGPHQAYPQSHKANVYQLANNISWIRGRHTVKAGYDGRKLNSTNYFVQYQRGEYDYNTLERFLIDQAPEFGLRSVGGFPFIGNLLSHYAFANDEIRLRPNLVVNLGLRYEHVGVPAGARLQRVNALASVPGVLDFREPESDNGNLAPRVGLAWSPGKSGRTSVRAGFGIAFDQTFHNLGMNSMPPQFSTLTFAQVSTPDAPGFLARGGIPATAAQITDPASARAMTSAWIPDQQRPYSIQWNLAVQQVMARDYTVEVRYLGTRGVHLPSQLQINRQAAVTDSSRSLPTFLARPTQDVLDSLAVKADDFRAVNTLAPHGFMGVITSFMPRGNSIYHGLATQVTRRYANGLQFTAAHTWSHNIDDSTAVVASTVLTPRRPQDFFNLSAERADSALDRRHRFTLGWTYDTPWFKQSGSSWQRHALGNWSLSGTYMAETGAWATVRSGVDSNVNGDPVGDRTVINPAGSAGKSSAVTALTNSAGKVVGYLANDPSARYIQAGRGVFPNSARNTLRLPGINNFDLTLAKRFAVAERRLLEFRAEAYNAFNHAQFVPGFVNSVNLRARVDGGANSLVLAGNPMFNRPDMAFQSNARIVQLVARFAF